MVRSVFLFGALTLLLVFGDYSVKAGDVDSRAEDGSILIITDSDNYNTTCDPDINWHCRNGQCILRAWRCDGQPDCSDQSDEPESCRETECPSGHFKCTSGQCILKQWHCDGRPDCRDLSDEVNCTAITVCPKENGKFLCNNGKCIDAIHVCDSKAGDCSDGSDEFPNCANSCKNSTCEHRCMPMMLDQPGFCYCNAGYTISGREKSRCSDVNECEILATCSQACTNTEGSFRCGCIEGFKLDEDNRTCSVKDEDINLVFGLKNSVRKYSITHRVQTSLVEKVGTPVGLAYDSGNNYIYWTDVWDYKEAIYRSKLDGTQVEAVVDTGLVLPEGVAYDWIGENIYFTDANSSHIGVCNSEGTKCAIIVQEVDKPRDIAVNPNLGYMFWSDWGTVAAIMKAGMDGSTPVAIISTDLRWPNGITIDHGSGRIFWNDASSDTLETSNFQGEDRQVVRSTGIKHPFSIEVFGDWLFWSDWSSGEIQSCNKFTGKNHSVLVKEHTLLNGLVIIHPANQPRLRANNCLNTKCSHLCTLTPTQSYRCQCPVGMKLDSKNKKTCQDIPSHPKLLIAHDNILKILRMDSIGRKVLDQHNLNGIQIIGSAIYNPLNNVVILSDITTKKIYEYNLQKKTLDILLQRHIDVVKGMDIDIVGQNLYWADTMRRTVEVMSLRTKERLVILRENDRPMDLVVVPEIKLMFVALIGQKGGKILKLSLNGYNRGVVIRIPNGEPTALTYNRELGHIFWLDSIHNTIEHASLDGRSNFEIIPRPGTPFGLTSYGNKIFYTDRHTQMLSSNFVSSYHKAPSVFIGDQEKTNRTSEAFEQGNFFAKVSIMLKDTSFARDLIKRHECSKNATNGCSHICLISEEDFVGTCVCPEGFQLDADRKTCSLQKTCFQTQFTCNDSRCISEDWKCDGTPDCIGGEDEKNCDVIKRCRTSDFVCESDNNCVPGHWKCDGEQDCHDGSDEKNCTMKACAADADFRCESGRCIPKSWQCDHQADCPDSSDEKNCNFTCPAGYFQCKGTEMKCISGDWVCDGTADCFDGSDEHANCSSSECSPKDFRCFNQACVHKELLCNGVDDCGDNSDESQCAINATVIFSPRSGPSSRRRNNATNDDDGGSPCGLDEYWCLSGECLSLNQTCDNIKNCMDGSDEGLHCDKACKSTNECSSICYKTPRGSRCSCPSGQSLADDKKSCDDINECETLNPCDHFCSNTKGSYKCSCHPSYLLKSDYKTCKANGKPPLYVFAWDSRVYVSPQDLQSTVSFEAKPRYLSGMDVDSYSGYVYWSNSVRGIVSRLNVDPKITSETLITGLSTPTHLAYDWISNNLFVVAYALEGRESRKILSIKICTLRQDIPEKHCAILFHIMGDEVTSMKVAPEYKFVFWSEISFRKYGGVSGAIRRGSIDGSEAISLAVDKVIYPKGLAVDHVRQRVLWADSKTNQIEAINFEGRNRQTIIPSGVNSAVSGLALFENWVIWNELGKQIRCRVDIQSQCAHVPFKDVRESLHLNVLQQSLQPRATNQCDKNDCNYICVPSIASSYRSRHVRPYKCLCPENYSPVDGLSLKCVKNEEAANLNEASPDDNEPMSLGPVFHIGNDRNRDNEIGRRGHVPRLRIVDEVSTDSTSSSSSSGETTGIVLGVLVLVVIVLAIIAVILHRRNVHPKVLVRPYVQQWVKYVNEPVQRFFGDNSRSQTLNGEKHLYDEVYHSGGGSTYSNPGYEEIDCPSSLYTALDEMPKGQPRSYTDSGLQSERNSGNSLYEDDAESHCISYSQKDRLIN